MHTHHSMDGYLCSNAAESTSNIQEIPITKNIFKHKDNLKIENYHLKQKNAHFRLDENIQWTPSLRISIPHEIMITMRDRVLSFTIFFCCWGILSSNTVSILCVLSRLCYCLYANLFTVLLIFYPTAWMVDIISTRKFFSIKYESKNNLFWRKRQYLWNHIGKRYKASDVNFLDSLPIEIRIFKFFRMYMELSVLISVQILKELWISNSAY